MLKYLPLLLFYFIVQVGAAQQNMTLYQLHDIIQSHNLNPSIPASCGWTLGMPALGNISLSLGAPVSYKDLGAGTSTLNTTELVDKLKNKNLVSTNINVNLFFLGYRSEKNYFQLSINERVSGGVSAPKNALQLGFQGNGGFVGETMDLDFHLQGLAYHEMAFSWAHEISDNLWIGIRPKILFGIAGIKAERAQMQIYTDPLNYDLDLTSDILINMSAPGTVELDKDGYFNKFHFDRSASNYLSTKNTGFGIDLGISKENEDGWNYSASILNIGSISWKANSHSFSQKHQMTYTGPTPSINNWEDLADSLRSVIKLTPTSSNFSQSLSPVVMLAASKPIHEYWRAGLTGMIEPISKIRPWALTGTVFTQNTGVLTGAFSYTVTPYSFVNIGAGLGLRAGAFQIHVLSDNIISLFSPYNQRYASIQMGINFRFGCGNGREVSSSNQIQMIPCPKGASRKFK